MQTGALLYEAVRSTDPTFTASCTSQVTGEVYWDDAAPSSPGGLYYYLVHPLTPNPGSWGMNGDDVERTIPCLGG